MANWNHPKLGSFKFDGMYWSGTCTLSAFKPFIFREGARNSGRAKLTINFETESCEEDELPSNDAQKVALQVIQNHNELSSCIVQALWQDMHNQGSGSGMWWNGDIETIERNIAEATKNKLRALRAPETLYKCLGANSVLIRESMYLYEKPSATFLFQAAFDTEHGLGILSDGGRVIGIGYQSSVGPFFEEQIR